MVIGLGLLLKNTKGGQERKSKTILSWSVQQYNMYADKLPVHSNSIPPSIDHNPSTCLSWLLCWCESINYTIA